KENILPISESGQLKLTTDGAELFPGFRVKFVHGHTGAMMIPHISYLGKTVVYMADLLPSVAHIPTAYVMAYDTRPLITFNEKTIFLKEALDNDYILFFEHDPIYECCSLKNTERGIRLNDTFPLSSIIG
ncbi:MAG TPA: MBL fold metallo-hydrolase, partial [Bacteroidia bacterium]|nr:MBL fold metallo-hydrolase [Bacteroidia bacterium]